MRDISYSEERAICLNKTEECFEYNANILLIV